MTGTPARDRRPAASLSVKAAGAGVVLSVGSLVAFVYQGWTYGGTGSIQVPIPAMLALATLCTGIALLVVTACTRTRS